MDLKVVGTKIQLRNRDRVPMWLEEGNDGLYTLKTSGDSLYTEYIRIIGEDGNNPNGIDPPGGPFISIGDNLGDNNIVKHIYFPPLKFLIEKS